MPRRDNIAKILVMVAAISIPAAAQQSFYSYIGHQKSHTIDDVEGRFLMECGVPTEGEKHVFAINRTAGNSPGRWERRKNLLQGNAEAETDFFDTVEVRPVGGRPRVLNVWFLVMDVGQESNALLCLDEKGVLRFTRAVTGVTPVDGSGPGWTYVQVRYFDTNGKVTATDFYVSDEWDHRVPNPKLSKEDELVLGWNPDRTLVVDVLGPLGLLDRGKER